MNYFFYTGLIFCIGILFTSCGDLPPAEVPVPAAPEVSSRPAAVIQQTVNQAGSKAHDTIAMSFEELKNFLPKELKGFKAGEAGQLPVKNGVNCTKAQVKFENKKGDWVKVSIFDYGYSPGLYEAALEAFDKNMQVDNAEQKASGTTLEGYKGWETYFKIKKEAFITLGVAKRFWVNVEASNQKNTDLVKAVAKKAELEKLSKF